jgi:hypothetical protein
MARPQTWLEATQHAKESQHVVSAQTRKPPFIPLTRPTNPAPHPTPLNIHKLTWDEMVEHQIKGFVIIVMTNIFQGTSVRAKNYPIQLILLCPSS